MTAGTGWRLAVATAGMMILATPAMADVRAGAEAWARGDYARAITEWRSPALAGDADAQFNMGQAYKLGRGVPADLAQAEVWYQKAAVQGHEKAQDSYGLALFQDGRRAEALPWLEKSVARDEKRTELILGTMLFNGDGVSKDWVRAYALVSRSSQQGLPQASQTLAQMDGYLSPEQRQQGVAMAGQIADRGRSAQVAGLAGPAPAPMPDPVPGRGRGSTTAALPTPDIAGPPPHAAIAATDLPPSNMPDRRWPSGTKDVPPADAGPRPSRHASHAEPRPAPVTAQPSPKPAVTAGGRWRVQLGAFHDEANARALWSRIAARIGGQPAYTHAGAVVRLQAGPFASKADAERACHAAGTSCVIVP